MTLYKSLVKKVSIPADKKTKQKEYEEVGQLAIIDQGKKLIGGYTNNLNMQLECTLPVIIFGDHTCAVKYVDFPFGAGADGIKVLSPKNEVLPKYLFYGTQYLILRFPDKGYARHYQHIEKMDLRLPELEEQLRIVNRIEELFSELEKGVETLETIKKQLTVYRQAVLKEAFEGNFTTSWRSKHILANPQNDFESIRRPNEKFKDTSGDENEISLVLPNTWIKIRVGEVFEVQVGATPSRRVPEYWNGDINWISSGEVHFDSIYRTNEQITTEGLAHTSTNVHSPGTVVLAMIGEGKTRGQAAILKTEAAHNQNTAAILVSQTPCSSEYIYYFLQMNYDNTRRVGSGNNQKALNKERVRALRFPFTSFLEQYQIVEEIESRLSVCDSIEQTVDTALSQAEALRQSILKKAFEGGLSE